MPAPQLTQARLLAAIALRTHFREVRERLRAEAGELRRLLSRGVTPEPGPIPVELVTQERGDTETRKLLLDGQGMED